MPERIAAEERQRQLSGEERCALKELLAYVEDRVRGHDPICAKLVQMARLALDSPDIAPDGSRVLH